MPASCVLALGLLAACAGPSHTLSTADIDSLSSEQPVVSAESLAAPPQQGSQVGRNGAVSLGVGFSADPDTFLLGATVDMPAGDNVYWGPALQFGADGAKRLIPLYLQIKYLFNSGQSLSPFIQGGGGIVYYDPSGSSSRTRGMLNAGGGLRLAVGDSMMLSSTLLFNWVPQGIGSDYSYLTWEMFQLTIPF